jgi:shikimate dehydrogenase
MLHAIHKYIKPGANKMEHSIAIQKVPTFYFIGVTTTKSSIMKVFPLWAKELGHPEVVIKGVDLRIHDKPDAYRKIVEQIKFDGNSLGALVTTHKIDLLKATHNLFEYLDPYAQLCNEISCISKLEGRLEGHAKDPITVGWSMDDLIGDEYFKKTGGEVLCFGAGGSGVATAIHIISKKSSGDRPKRCVVVNRSPGRLVEMEKLVMSLNTDIHFEFICNSDPIKNNEFMAGMPPGSIVINATGMGKDVPGSPITDNGKFPEKGIAWDFNYRGELDFMHQALRQQKERNLIVEDGWLYFIHGWTQVIAQVFHLDLTSERVDQLAFVAEFVRPIKEPGLRR